jgi:dTDP-4-amino-4,6-dideoxygalactose transaminase|tara:strand:- start:1554 stop:2657 length:1104 start_codon:yes stop_codon:yes gene_type:complete
MNQNIKIPFVDLYPQYEEIQTEIDLAIKDIITRSDFITGPTVDKFEKAICEYTGAEDCASIGSGTNALVCSLRALGIGTGDTVWTVGHTFVSTTEAIVNVDARPEFIDIDQFYHLDIENIPEFDPQCPPAAILFVDLYGQTPDIDKLKKFANKYKIKLIEDAAQSFGAEYKGKKVGSLVDLTCFSFNPVKNLGAMGDAGAVTGDKELVDKVRMYRDHGRKTKFEYETVGYNARIDNLQAVIVQAKLKKIDGWLDKKREICKRYTEQLHDIVKCPKEASWSKHTYYVYVIETPQGTRDKLQMFLKDKGIATNIHYKFPTHKTKAFDTGAELPKTEYICDNIISLPCYHTLPEHHQEYIVKAIREFYAN